MLRKEEKICRECIKKGLVTNCSACIVRFKKMEKILKESRGRNL